MYLIHNVRQLNGFFSQAVSFKVSLKETLLRIQLMYAWQLTMCGKSTKRNKTHIKKFVTYWFFECKSICYSKSWSLPHHRNCQALEQLQRKELITHKVLKLLKRSGSQCKYTSEYRFKIAKQPTLNRATSATTYFQWKYTSIPIWEPAATEAVIGGILWKKLFLKIFSIFTGKLLCQSLFLINLLTWRPGTL